MREVEALKQSRDRARDWRDTPRLLSPRPAAFRSRSRELFVCVPSPLDAAARQLGLFGAPLAANQPSTHSTLRRAYPCSPHLAQ
jgi:hypothetical protein